MLLARFGPARGAAAEIVWLGFVKPDRAMKKAVAETEAFGCTIDLR
jgi:hypothetical protein